MKSYLLSLILASSPIETDTAIFLFDTGDKNMIASMLTYAQKEDPSTLKQLDFKIVFMGASVNAMSEEPFSLCPDHLIHYKDLQIEETIDHTWKRDRLLCSKSLENLSNKLIVKKNVWVGVSCSIFEQLAHHYQDTLGIPVTAVRDNPSPEGSTDYFSVAASVQKSAKQVLLPSIIGHPPTEEWVERANQLNKEEIFTRLNLDSSLPIIAYTGVYGETYKESFQQFLDFVSNQKDLQVLVVPHPRYKGIIEKSLCPPEIRIISPEEANTLEILSIASFVVTADATSTIVFQAAALKKPLLYINPHLTEIPPLSEKLLQKISSPEEFLSHIQTPLIDKPDFFSLLGIPRHGAQNLWNAFLYKSTLDK